MLDAPGLRSWKSKSNPSNSSLTLRAVPSGTKPSTCIQLYSIIEHGPGFMAGRAAKALLSGERRKSVRSRTRGQHDESQSQGNPGEGCCQRRFPHETRPPPKTQCRALQMKIVFGKCDVMLHTEGTSTDKRMALPGLRGHTSRSRIFHFSSPVVGCEILHLFHVFAIQKSRCAFDGTAQSHLQLGNSTEIR